MRKDATASSVHATTALGNDRPQLRGATMFANIRKPTSRDVDPGTEIDDDVGARGGMGVDVDKAFAKASLVKVDESLGLVFGFAIVCKKDGEDYFDLQGDNIPEDAMLKASLDFMLNSRMAKEMHEGDAAGTVVFAFPLTGEIAKALEIETKQTGLLIAMRPAEGMMAKFKSGELQGFSIGGRRLLDEEVAYSP